MSGSVKRAFLSFYRCGNIYEGREKAKWKAFGMSQWSKRCLNVRRLVGCE